MSDHLREESIRRRKEFLLSKLRSKNNGEASGAEVLPITAIWAQSLRKINSDEAEAKTSESDPWEDD